MTKTFKTFDEINDATGFAQGTEFTSEQQVREYFQASNMTDMFGADAITDQDVLDAMAARVIANRWHMA